MSALKEGLEDFAFDLEDPIPVDDLIARLQAAKDRSRDLLGDGYVCFLYVTVSIDRDVQGCFGAHIRKTGGLAPARRGRSYDEMEEKISDLEAEVRSLEYELYGPGEDL